VNVYYLISEQEKWKGIILLDHRAGKDALLPPGALDLLRLPARGESA